MYIMCFNVSICLKMGSLYSYCNKLVYPPELQDFVLILIFLGEDPQTPLSIRIVWACIITTIQQII